MLSLCLMPRNRAACSLQQIAALRNADKRKRRVELAEYPALGRFT